MIFRCPFPPRPFCDAVILWDVGSRSPLLLQNACCEERARCLRACAGGPRPRGAPPGVLGGSRAVLSGPVLGSWPWCCEMLRGAGSGDLRCGFPLRIFTSTGFTRKVFFFFPGISCVNARSAVMWRPLEACWAPTSLPGPSIQGWWGWQGRHGQSCRCG